MFIYDSCRPAVRHCEETGTFAVARLYNNEKTMGIHIHDCYEIYFSISGGKQFLIDGRVYDFEPGDIFFINQSESHCLSKVDKSAHMRVIISVCPEYLKQFSTKQTDLNYCFTYRDPLSGHKRSLSVNERKRFLYYIHRLSEQHGFGRDVLDQAVFLELMTFLNGVFLSQGGQERDETRCGTKRIDARIDEISDYINQNLAENLSIPMIADHFYLSGSYMSKIFKDATGTTIYQYITAKRISRAKVLLAEGHPVAETSSLCGFGDYSNFLKSFTRAVGISPKKYASFTNS